MKYIPLTRGKFAIVDDEDFKRISRYKWSCNGIYAARHAFIKNRWITLRMHRFILKAPKNRQVDHKNGDGLDNRRINIRLCTSKENSRNRNKQINNISGYNGVHWNKKKWISRIQINGKRIYLGCFISKKEAAKKYDSMAKKYFGKFARLNIK